MNLLLTTLIALVVILPTCPESQSRGWHGIVPLRSRRADVIRLLGRPNVDVKYYEIDNYTVHIDYSDSPCEKGKSGWNVVRDTVISISVGPTQDLKLSDLQIDKKKLKTSQDGELPGIIYYTNDAEGTHNLSTSRRR